MRMEKKKTRARFEKRRRKWVTKNMLSTSSWIPIMILKIFLGRGENAVVAWAAQLATGGRRRTMLQWPQCQQGLVHSNGFHNDTFIFLKWQWILYGLDILIRKIKSYFLNFLAACNHSVWHISRRRSITLWNTLAHPSHQQNQDFKGKSVYSHSWLFLKWNHMVDKRSFDLWW